MTGAHVGPGVPPCKKDRYFFFSGGVSLPESPKIIIVHPKRWETHMETKLELGICFMATLRSPVD